MKDFHSQHKCLQMRHSKTRRILKKAMSGMPNTFSLDYSTGYVQQKDKKVKVGKRQALQRLCHYMLTCEISSRKSFSL